MRQSLSSKEPIAIATRASELKGMPNTFAYDARRVGVSNLPSLTAEQCQTLLGLIEANLKDLRAWVRDLAKRRKVAEDELVAAANDPAYSGNVYEARQAVALIDGGVRGSGVPVRFVELLKPLMPANGTVEEVAAPGITKTQALIQKLQADREYLQAYIERWPSSDAVQPYRISPLRTAAVFRKGRRVERDELVQLTEAEARAEQNIFEPAGKVPQILTTYATALNVAAR
jgi:hypothetical protein